MRVNLILAMILRQLDEAYIACNNFPDCLPSAIWYRNGPITFKIFLRSFKFSKFIFKFVNNLLKIDTASQLKKRRMFCASFSFIIYACIEVSGVYCNLSTTNSTFSLRQIIKLSLPYIIFHLFYFSYWNLKFSFNCFFDAFQLHKQ